MEPAEAVERPPGAPRDSDPDTDSPGRLRPSRVEQPADCLGGGVPSRPSQSELAEAGLDNHLVTHGQPDRGIAYDRVATRVVVSRPYTCQLQIVGHLAETYLFQFLTQHGG